METSLSGLRAAHVRFELADASGVAFARRGATELARQMGFDETDLGRVAIVVTEASTNILKHAGHGEILVRQLPAAPDGTLPGGIEIVAMDQGPGMIDVAQAFRDGNSTAGTPGTGLGAVRRLSEEVSVYSQPRLGTVLRAVLRSRGGGAGTAAGAGRTPATIDVGGICVPYPGESVSGDAWSVEADHSGFTLTVADGLGHGPDAHVAAAAAIDVARRRAGRSPSELMELAHGALRSTRGAALAIARLDLARGRFTFAGTGNIGASAFNVDRPRLVNGAHGASPAASEPSDPRAHWQLASRNGIVGHTMRDAQEFEVEWTRNALVVLFSDGIGTRWDLFAYPGLFLQPAAMIAAVLYRDFTRKRDDATVLVVKAQAPLPREP